MSPTDGERKPIGECRWRQRVRVVGRVRALRVQPWEGGVATLEATLVDDTGGITVIFMGRQQIAGLREGRGGGHGHREPRPARLDEP